MNEQGSKSWLKEIVVGVAVTVLAAVIMSRLGINNNGPAEPGSKPAAAASAGLVPRELPTATIPAQPVDRPTTPAAPPLGPRPASAATVDTARATAISTSTIPTSTISTSIVGKWEQWCQHPETKEWIFGGLYRVTIQRQKLAMQILDNSAVDADFVNTQGITETAFDGEQWTFNSHLEIGKPLQFQLHRVDDDTYEGHCIDNGVATTVNRWTRVK